VALSDAARQAESEPELARYSRQILFEPIGVSGQRKLLESRVVLIGCGALGSVLAEALVRAGVGRLRIIDRDFLEMSNLQRQILFDEDDVAAGLPKAEAARRKLRRINSSVDIEAVIADVDHRNIASLIEGAELLLDGTDNFETRFLVNDVAVKTRRPWIYGAVIAATGLSMPVLPNETPCLRCLFEQAPPPELSPTCDTAGVLGPLVSIVAGYQALEAIKILSGNRSAVSRGLLRVDAWNGRISLLNVQNAYDAGQCPCCKERRFEHLEGRFGSNTTVLCGRDAVQVRPPPGLQVDFAAIAAKLRGVADRTPKYNEYLLKAWVGGREISLFPDGRAIILGTDKPEEARAIYARYIGA